jgi:CheY-like chemotaxis protein
MLLTEAKQALRSLANRLQETLPDGRERAESELAEILVYLIRLANRSGLDLVAAADRKVHRDIERLPTLVPDQRPIPSGDARTAAADRPLRILIVEDERIVAADLQHMLQDLGYDAFAIAATGADALSISRQTPPDIALMDIRIRGLLDGVETALQLRREFNTAVIFLTAHADDATLQRAKHSEPYGYLLKPVNAPLLRTTIELTSHRHRSE